MPLLWWLDQLKAGGSLRLQRTITPTGVLSRRGGMCHVMAG
jgi:hypothetical protein